MAIKIIDLDNCISNDGWRYSMIDWHKDLHERWDRYHAHSYFDEFCNQDLIQGGDDIVIFTTRPDNYRAITMKWLVRNKISPLSLYMRKSGDLRESVAVKREMLDTMMMRNLKISHQDITCAYDDRADVVDMYISQGVNAEQRMINDYLAYKRLK